MFQLWYFLRVALSEFKFMFATNPSSCPCNFFFHVVYPFLFLFLEPNIPSKLFWYPLHSVFDLSLCFLFRLVSRMFFCDIRRSCFVCVAWRCPNVFPVSFLPSINFGLLPPNVLSVLSTLVFFSVSLFLLYFLSLAVSLVVVHSFVRIVSFPIQVLYFTSWSLDGDTNFIPE